VPPAAPFLHPLAGQAGKGEVRRNWLLVKYYWHRIFGTSLSWFVWDFAVSLLALSQLAPWTASVRRVFSGCQSQTGARLRVLLLSRSVYCVH
jgi:hypothetical protein